MATAFAGPLCRHFAGEHGDAAQLAAGVDAWRRDVNEALGRRLQKPLAWREDPDGECATFDLDDSGWRGLRLFAFHAERADLEMPDTVPALLELHKEWRAAAETKFGKSLYGQLLAPRLWLPGEFGFTFHGLIPDGASAEVGSLRILQDQLRWLNQRTFQVDVEVLVDWQREPAPAGAELLTAARRGLGSLTAAVAFAIRRAVPLLVEET